MFHAENARFLSELAVFVLWTYAALVVGGFQGGHRKANVLLGALPDLCRNVPLEPRLPDAWCAGSTPSLRSLRGPSTPNSLVRVTAFIIVTVQ